MILLQFSVAFIGIFLVQIWDILFQKKQKNAIIFKKIVGFKTNKKPRKTAGIWCRLSDLNQRPTDYKSAALPTELNRQCQPIIHICTHNASKKIIKYLDVDKMYVCVRKGSLRMFAYGVMEGFCTQWVMLVHKTI